jgi:heme oxygenase
VTHSARLMSAAPVKNRPSRGHAHDRLRAATRRLHDSLDRSIASSVVTTREGFIRYLLANWPCASIEPALVDAGIHRLLPDWDRRQRRAALADDLTALGVPLPPSQPCSIAKDAGTLLGWSYVLEGSRLGARMILQAVAAAGSPEIKGAMHFLRHGEGVDLWGSFKAALAQIDHDPAAIARACDAARDAFGRFIASSHDEPGE